MNESYFGGGENFIKDRAMWTFTKRYACCAVLWCVLVNADANTFFLVAYVVVVCCWLLFVTLRGLWRWGTCAVGRALARPYAPPPAKDPYVEARGKYEETLR